MRLAIATAAMLLGALALPPASEASQLVYEPISPSFGGDPFAGTFLLESAISQNQHSDGSGGGSNIDIPDFDFDSPPIIIEPGTGETQGAGETQAPQVD